VEKPGDIRLLRFYLEQDARWNLSPQCAYLEYRLRSWAAHYLLPPLDILNVGIGAGLWDDYLGYLLDGRGTLTSVDRDAEVCELFRYRQAREQHPAPARVVCADLLADELQLEFDAVTLIGSTATELGPHGEVLAAAGGRVRSGGMLFYSDDAASHPAERFRQLCPALGLEVRGFEEDRRLNLPFYLFVAARA
jgi:SAM-dependent methyltransferase